MTYGISINKQREEGKRGRKYKSKEKVILRPVDKYEGSSETYWEKVLTAPTPATKKLKLKYISK